MPNTQLKTTDVISEVRVLAAVRQSPTPLTRDELIKALRVPPRKRDAFADQLTTLIRLGKLFENRKKALCLPEAINVVTGLVVGHPDGHGFLQPDQDDVSYYIPAREMFKALHGDRVTAKPLHYESHGKQAVELLDVLEHTQQDIVGRLYERHGVWFVVAEDRRINQDLLLAGKGRSKAKEGDIVSVTIVEPPNASHEAIVKIKEVLGRKSDDGIEIEIALRQYDLPFRFSDKANADADKAGKRVKVSDKRQRTDLTHLPFVTIDGETARDFDDAVFAEKQGRGYRLLVAIADVSHYVKEGSALDEEARQRGTSVYFPRRVIPMLPETLSNGLCSLNPNVERLVMVCEMSLSPKGLIKKSQFYPATIRSQARLTYTEVWDYLSSGHRTEAMNDDVRASLDLLYKIYQYLLANRKQRGAIDFETNEMQIHFDDHGKIDSVGPLERNDAHRLIEECMLAANVCAAELLRKQHANTLYRVHDKPKPEKLANLHNFLALCGLQMGGGEHPQTKDFATLLDKIQGRDDKLLLQTLLLRSLQRAEYTPEDREHFGLAYPHYTHFTSPIRRYPDLLVHRGIKAILTGVPDGSDPADWEELGRHCSMTERRADDATRTVENWLKCEYMQQRINDIMTGTISGVTHFGLFVTLDNLAIDGLIHISELGTEYFTFDATRHALVGRHTGKTYQLTDRLIVRVVRADPESGKIDFLLSDETALAQFEAQRAAAQKPRSEPTQHPAKVARHAAKKIVKKVAPAKKAVKKTATKTPAKSGAKKTASAKKSASAKTKKPVSSKK